jgi:hypothetical protein
MRTLIGNIIMFLCLACNGQQAMFLNSPAVSAASGATNTILSGANVGTLRNDFSGKVGAEFTPQQNCHIILGRMVISGNNQTHVLSCGLTSTSIPFATDSVNTALGTPGTFLYGTVSIPLTNGVSYWISSTEVAFGDMWGTDTNGSVVVSDATKWTCLGSAYGTAGSSPTINTPGNFSYVPVNAQFTIP